MDVRDTRLVAPYRDRNLISKNWSRVIIKANFVRYVNLVVPGNVYMKSIGRFWIVEEFMEWSR